MEGEATIRDPDGAKMATEPLAVRARPCPVRVLRQLTEHPLLPCRPLRLDVIQEAEADDLRMERDATFRCRRLDLATIASVDVEVVDPVLCLDVLDAKLREFFETGTLVECEVR